MFHGNIQMGMPDNGFIKFELKTDIWIIFNLVFPSFKNIIMANAFMEIILYFPCYRIRTQDPGLNACLDNFIVSGKSQNGT